MSGGKGGRESTEVKIPAWLEDAAKESLARGAYTSEIGYTPYYGPDVAAMTPIEIAANQGLASAAGAFGLPGGELSMGTEGMPMPQTFAGGVQGYSSGGLYDQALAELEARRPGQYNAITGMYIDPITGAPPALSFGPSVQPMAPMASAPMAYSTQGGGRDRDGMGGMSAGAGAAAVSGGACRRLPVDCPARGRRRHWLCGGHGGPCVPSRPDVCLDHADGCSGGRDGQHHRDDNAGSVGHVSSRRRHVDYLR